MYYCYSWLICSMNMHCLFMYHHHMLPVKHDEARRQMGYDPYSPSLSANSPVSWKARKNFQICFYEWEIVLFEVSFEVVFS